MRTGKSARGNRFRQAALARLRDSDALRRTAQGYGGVRAEPERWGGAAYLAGMALECQAKWALCERHGVTHVDDVAPELIRHAGHDIGRCLQEAGLLTGIKRHHPDAWAVIETWSVDWRYNPPGQPTATEAERFIECCERVFQWLNESAV